MLHLLQLLHHSHSPTQGKSWSLLTITDTTNGIYSTSTAAVKELITNSNSKATMFYGRTVGDGAAGVLAWRLTFDRLLYRANAQPSVHCFMLIFSLLQQ